MGTAIVANTYGDFVRIVEADTFYGELYHSRAKTSRGYFYVPADDVSNRVAGLSIRSYIVGPNVTLTTVDVARLQLAQERGHKSVSATAEIFDPADFRLPYSNKPNSATESSHQNMGVHISNLLGEYVCACYYPELGLQIIASSSDEVIATVQEYRGTERQIVKLESWEELSNIFPQFNDLRHIVEPPSKDDFYGILGRLLVFGFRPFVVPGKHLEADVLFPRGNPTFQRLGGESDPRLTGLWWGFIKKDDSKTYYLCVEVAK